MLEIVIFIYLKFYYLFYFILSIFTNNHYNSEYKYFNIQEQIIISMMLEGHSREGTNASPFPNQTCKIHKKTLKQQNHKIIEESNYNEMGFINFMLKGTK